MKVPGVVVSERPSASLRSHSLSFWWPVRSVLLSVEVGDGDDLSEELKILYVVPP